MKVKKVYIAGKITGDPAYREKFARAEARLRALGHIVMNPAILPDGFTHAEYMLICFAMIDVCDAVFFLSDWVDSDGAWQEHGRALEKDKIRIYS